MIVLALLIGGLSQVSRQSQGYRMTSNRALAAQGAVLADQSNATGSQVRKLVNSVSSETRQGLQAGLDAVVEQTSDQSAQADLAVHDNPLGSVGSEFATVFAERAESMDQLRSAVDDYLGMQPIPNSGTPAGAPSGSAAPLSATQATNRIAAAGALLSRADSLYGSVRRSLGTTAGHGRLPRSVWVTDPQLWQLGTVAAQVDLMATSPALAATHDVVIRTTRLVPPPHPPPPGPALPTPQGTAATVAVLSPTRSVGVTTVLANQGSVGEPHVSVRYSMADQSTGATATHVETTSIALDGSVTLPSVVFTVTPSTTYVLTVQIVLPSGQTQTNGTIFQQALQVAPAT
jgi:ElaB/YqjD/DUF883 family membrane-anchored ribosome-binding protein